MPTNPLLTRTVRLALRTIMRAWAYYFLQTTIMRSMSIQDSSDSDIDMIDEPESQWWYHWDMVGIARSHVIYIIPWLGLPRRVLTQMITNDTRFLWDSHSGGNCVQPRILLGATGDMVTPMAFAWTFYARVTFKKHHIMTNQRFQCSPCWFSTKVCSIAEQKWWPDIVTWSKEKKPRTMRT